MEETIQQPPPAPRMSRAAAVYARFSELSDRYGLARKLAILLTIVALVSAFATYAVITGSLPLGADTRNVLILLQIDLVVFLMLGLVVSRNLVGLWMERPELIPKTGLGLPRDRRACRGPPRSAPRRYSCSYA